MHWIGWYRLQSPNFQVWQAPRHHSSCYLSQSLHSGCHLRQLSGHILFAGQGPAVVIIRPHKYKKASGFKMKASLNNYPRRHNLPLCLKSQPPSYLARMEIQRVMSLPTLLVMRDIAPLFSFSTELAIREFFPYIVSLSFRTWYWLTQGMMPTCVLRIIWPTRCLSSNAIDFQCNRVEEYASSIRRSWEAIGLLSSESKLGFRLSCFFWIAYPTLAWHRDIQSPFPWHKSRDPPRQWCIEGTSSHITYPIFSSPI